MEKPPLYLRIEQGPKTGSSINMCKLSRITIGRARSNTLQIKDAAISQQHLSVLWNGRDWTVTDLGSSNGTLVNDYSAAPGKAVRLKDGDCIKIGENTTFRVEERRAGARTGSKVACKKRGPGEPDGGAFEEAHLRQPDEASAGDEEMTVRQWFAQKIETVPRYMYEVSESLIAHMKLRSEQLDEYLCTIGETTVA